MLLNWPAEARPSNSVVTRSTLSYPPFRPIWLIRPIRIRQIKPESSTDTMHAHAGWAPHACSQPASERVVGETHGAASVP
jgi:hypothetical protein